MKASDRSDEALTRTGEPLVAALASSPRALRAALYGVHAAVHLIEAGGDLDAVSGVRLSQHQRRVRREIAAKRVWT
jgi:hypothetical protein